MNENVTVELQPELQKEIRRVYPHLATTRQMANQVRRILWDHCQGQPSPAQQIQAGLSYIQANYDPPAPEPATPPKVIAQRIAGLAPDIDLRNMVLIAKKIEPAMTDGKWSAALEHDLIEELNQPFNGVRHGPSVQNSRITDFFDWIL